MSHQNDSEMYILFLRVAIKTYSCADVLKDMMSGKTIHLSRITKLNVVFLSNMHSSNNISIYSLI